VAGKPRARSANAGSNRPGVAISGPSLAVLLLAAAGVILRLWQYLSNTSLWLDEAAVARNIVDRSPQHLFQPLDYAQVAPPGFLLAEKAMVALFGNSEWALRLFPLLCGVVAIATFWRIATWTLTGWGVPYAVGLFALATPLVYFSSHVKQYSSDVLATLVLLGAVTWLRRDPQDRRRAIIVAIAGALTVWFSQPALLVLAGCGLALAVSSLMDRRRANLPGVLVVGLVWGLSAAAAATLALQNVSTADRAYLDWYWKGGFMPFPPRSASDAIWLWERLSWIFGRFVTGLRRTNGGLGYPWSHLFVILTIVGAVALWKRRRDAALIVVMPLALTIVASALHLYPFTGRVLSFLLPVLLLLTAAGTDYALTHWQRRLQFAWPVLLALAVGSPLFATLAALPPERSEHLRPVMAAVAERRQAEDDIYVYYGAGQAFMYYAPRFGLDGARFVLGRCSVTDPRVYLRDLDRLRGKSRVWIVATHARLGATELLLMLRYLDTIGKRVESIEIPATLNLPSIAAYGFLYDLSDKARLLKTNSDVFPVRTPPVDAEFTEWGCYGTQSALGRP
jgi:uncharacterized membrane protein